MKTLGGRLKSARIRRGLTQEEVAKMLGRSNGTISGYERNYRDPDTDTLTLLAELYNVSVDYLAKGEETKLSEETDLDKTKKDIMKIINENLNIEELELTLEVIKKMLKK